MPCFLVQSENTVELSGVLPTGRDRFAQLCLQAVRDTSVARFLDRCIPREGCRPLTPLNPHRASRTMLLFADTIPKWSRPVYPINSTLYSCVRRNRNSKTRIRLCRTEKVTFLCLYLVSGTSILSEKMVSVPGVHVCSRKDRPAWQRSCHHSGSSASPRDALSAP